MSRNVPRSLPAGWQLLSSEYLHNKPWLTVRQDSLLLPNGHVIPDYFVLEYPDWINVIAIDEAGSFILVHQYRHGFGAAHYELCAGVCEPGELPLKAAQRELMEETGYGGGCWEEWMVTSANPATSNNLVRCFIARDLKKIAMPAPEDSEQIETHLVTAEALSGLMDSGKIIQATHLAALWKYRAVFF